MVSVPDRVPPALASKLKVTTPSPVPLLLPRCSQAALLVAVQLVPVFSRTLSLPADGPSTSAVVPRLGGLCVTVTVCPSTEMWAVRAEGPGLAEKEKVTTPLVTPLMRSQDWSLLGANTPVSVSLAGRTGANWSLPA